MDVNKRLTRLKKSVETAKTEIRRNSNKIVFERILKYLKDARTETEFNALLLKDYSAFCAWYIDGKDEPFIPAPWQIIAAHRFVNHHRMFLLNCRRAGKSSWAASVIVWDMCRREKANHLIFAPTKQQLIIMDEVYKIINQSEFIIQNFVSTTNRRQKVEFKNGSSVEAFNIGIGGQEKRGDYLRGMGGNVVWIDEIGLVDATVRKEVINPIIRDAYGDAEKKMVFFGTPKLAYNPELEREWETKKQTDYWATMQVTCWQAMKEGIRTPSMMKEVFTDELYIPCSHVTSHGVCPEFAPELLDDVPSGWKCDQGYVCMDNDQYMMEDLASFPNNADRFYPKEWLNDACQNYPWYNPTQIVPGQKFVMSIDLGLLQDPTEVVIAEVIIEPLTNIKKLKYAAWKSINPWEEGESVESATQRHINEMKRMYHFFNPEIVYVDVTRGIDYASRLLEGSDKIPRSRFYTNETMERKEGFGCWWDGHFKSKIYLHHKDQLQRRRLIVPSDHQFFDKWFHDHYEVKAEPAHGGSYLSFGKKSRHLLDACAMLSLALLEDKPKKKGMSVDFIADWEL